jgi:predicted esterase
VLERTIETATHGRYLVAPASDGAPLLVGFHGYAEAAEAHMERMRGVPGADRWTLIAIQGLHRFYDRRTQSVIASWMTRQDRDAAIADNIAYVERVVAAESSGRRPPGIVFSGFSQGVAMAFRAAAASTRIVLGVIAVGGDVPPEIESTALARLGRVLLVHGSRDEWYTNEKFQADRTRLTGAGVNVTALEFDGGHEWSAPVHEAASGFLDAVRSSRASS